MNTGATDDHFQVASKRPIDRMNRVGLFVSDATDHENDYLLRPENSLQIKPDGLAKKRVQCQSKYLPVSGDVVASEWIAGLFELSFDQLLDKLFHKWSMLSINVVHAFKALQNALGDGDRVLVVEQIGLSESAASVRTNSGQKLDKTTIFTMNKVVKMEARVSSYSPLSLNQ